MSISRINALAARIVHQLRRDKRTLALIFIVPIFILSLVGYIIHAQENSKFRIVIENRDKKLMTSIISGGFNASSILIGNLPTNDKIEFIKIESGDAEDKIRSGTFDAAIIFPEDFSRKLLLKRSISVIILTEGSNPALREQTTAALKGAIAFAAIATQKALQGEESSSMPEVNIEEKALYGNEHTSILDAMAPPLIAFFVFFLVFLLTCVSFLRERTLGTLERLHASPMTRAEIVFGYMIGFGIFAMGQSAAVVAFSSLVLGVKGSGAVLWAFIVTLLLAMTAVNTGIFCSTFARNELQAIQFIPIVIVPQGLLCGMLWPVRSMPEWLAAVANFLPMTHAVNAMNDIMIRGETIGNIFPELGILFVFAVSAAVLSVLTLKRVED